MFDVRLTYLLAVSREGSFTAAAKTVGVTQPAVTKSIADLEREIGYAIFHRTAQGAIPTERGKVFIERAARLLDDARDLLRNAIEPGDPYAGSLRVGVSPASMEWQIVEAIEVLLTRHAAIRLETTGGSFERIVHQLRNGAIDIAVGLDEAYAGWPELERQQVGTLKSDLFVRKEHPLADRAVVTVPELARFDFVSQPESKPYGDIIRRFYDAAGEHWRHRMHIVDYFPSAARIVRATDAIGMVQRAYTRTASFNRYFVRLNIDETIFPPSRLCCAYRRHRDFTPPMRAFVSALCHGSDRRA